MESYEQCRQGRSNCSLCTLDTMHRLFFVTRLIINKINQVQWVDFKLENVLVSLHSLKIMGLVPFGASAPLFLRNGELLEHSPIHNGQMKRDKQRSTKHYTENCSLFWQKNHWTINELYLRHFKYILTTGRYTRLPDISTKLALLKECATDFNSTERVGDSTADQWTSRESRFKLYDWYLC